jgi:hypothetical protein
VHMLWVFVMKVKSVTHVIRPHGIKPETKEFTIVSSASNSSNRNATHPHCTNNRTATPNQSTYSDSTTPPTIPSFGDPIHTNKHHPSSLALQQGSSRQLHPRCSLPRSHLETARRHCPIPSRRPQRHNLSTLYRLLTRPLGHTSSPTQGRSLTSNHNRLLSMQCVPRHRRSRHNHNATISRSNFANEVTRLQTLQRSFFLT